MRRAVVVLGSTVAGLAALFSYRTHVGGIAVASTAPAAPVVSASPSTPSSLLASASPSMTTKKATPKKSAAKRPAPAPTRTAAPPVTPPTTPAPATSAPPPKPSGTFTGPLENTQYGAVQVQITVSNGKITNANGSLPQGGSNVGQNALPQLNQEVLTVQSANIQGVSGATYTSEGYRQSLQQAIDQAGL
jgi:uncharacterized protein with FMN-binding domain